MQTWICHLCENETHNSYNKCLYCDSPRMKLHSNPKTMKPMKSNPEQRDLEQRLERLLMSPSPPQMPGPQPSAPELEEPNVGNIINNPPYACAAAQGYQPHAPHDASGPYLTRNSAYNQIPPPTQPYAANTANAANAASGAFQGMSQYKQCTHKPIITLNMASNRTSADSNAWQHQPGAQGALDELDQPGPQVSQQMDQMQQIPGQADLQVGDEKTDFEALWRGQQAQQAQQGLQPLQGQELKQDNANGEETDEFEGKANDVMHQIRAQQPWDDPVPSLIPIKNYSEQQAVADAATLRKALKEPEGKIDLIIRIAATRSQQQRTQIRAKYVNIDTILCNENTNKVCDLISDLKSVLSGNVKDIILSLFMRPGEFDSRLIEEACAGAGYNQTLLIQVLCTRTNEEIRRMKYAWEHSYSGKQPHDKTLKERVHQRTHKTFAKGNFQHLMDSILDCKRDESRQVDLELARQDAELLNRVIAQEKKREAKVKFVEIFCVRSWRHLRQLSKDFNDISKEYTLVKAIANTFGESATSQAMRLILEFAMQPYDFWAKRLQRAMKGMGTDDALLKRVVISRCEIDLSSVSEVFGQRYGNGKTLQKWIKDDTGGDYKEILLYLTNHHAQVKK